MAKIKYDKDSKILTIRLSNKKSVDSDVRKNVVVDYDKDGEVVNVEIMNINMEEFKTANNYFNKILKKEAVAV